MSREGICFQGNPTISLVGLLPSIPTIESGRGGGGAVGGRRGPERGSGGIRGAQMTGSGVREQGVREEGQGTKRRSRARGGQGGGARGEGGADFRAGVQGASREGGPGGPGWWTFEGSGPGF